MPQASQEVKDEKKEEKKEWIKAGREVATCAACGSRLFRPSKPDNSTWRCQRYIMGDQTPDCQKGIPRTSVLDADEVKAAILKRTEKHKLEDIG